MAGAGIRFKEAGYDLPKPLINILGKTMIERVVESLGLEGNYIFIVQKEHEQHKISETLKSIAPDCKIIYVDKLTEGAACTALLAKDLINNDDELIIANSDQYIEYDRDFFLDLIKWYDGVILTFRANDPKWSYCKVHRGFVTEVVEKQVVSNVATVGIYAFRKGSDFVWAAEQMIKKNIRTKGEFFLAPCFNELIQDGRQIITVDVDVMKGCGTPSDLLEFQKFLKDDSA